MPKSEVILLPGHTVDQQLGTLDPTFRRGHLDKRNARLLQEKTTVLVRVSADVNDSFYSRIYNHLGTGDARLVGHIDHAASGAHAVERCLDDGVLFSVKGTQAVAVYDQVPDIVTVGQTGWRTVVARCQDASVADDYSAYVGTITGAACGHGEGDMKEILIPRWAIGLRRGHAQR